MTPFRQSALTRESVRATLISAMEHADELGMSPAEIEAVIEDEIERSVIWINDTYQVAVKQIGNPFRLHDGAMVWLSIKRLDREPIHDWRDLQAIKNELVGADCEAVELYPAEERVVDTANQYALFCFTNPRIRFPFGWSERAVSDKPLGLSKNRPLGGKP